MYNRYTPVRFFRAPRRNPAYDNYRHRVERIARFRSERPFDTWFKSGEDREYFYLKHDKMAKNDQEVIDFLKESGYEIVDYRKGLARKPGSKRTAKIGKVIARLRKQEEADIKKRKSLGKVFDIKRELKSNSRFFDDMQRQFSASPYRGSQEDLVVAISQDEHDIAQMSTDRSWNSCMELGVGNTQAEGVFCEVEQGGLVAYLTKPGDNDIEYPISRILIRRMTSSNGHNIAVPEGNIYGADIEGFYEAVVKWLGKKQPDAPIGIYKLRGMDYSDTLNSDHFYLPDDPRVLVENFKRGTYDPKAFSVKVYNIVANNIKHCMDVEVWNEEDMTSGTIGDLIDEVDGQSFPTRDIAEKFASNKSEEINYEIDNCIEQYRMQFDSDPESFVEMYGYMLDLISESLDDESGIEEVEQEITRLEQEHPFDLFGVAEVEINNTNAWTLDIAKRILEFPPESIPGGEGTIYGILYWVRGLHESYHNNPGALGSPVPITSLTTVVAMIALKYPGIVTFDDILKFKVGLDRIKGVRDIKEVRRKLKDFLDIYATSYGHPPVEIAEEAIASAAQKYQDAIEAGRAPDMPAIYYKAYSTAGGVVHPDIHGRAGRIGSGSRGIESPVLKHIPAIPFLPDMKKMTHYWPGTGDRGFGGLVAGFQEIKVSDFLKILEDNPSNIFRIIEREVGHLKMGLFDPIAKSFDQVPEPMVEKLIEISNNYTDRMMPYDRLMEKREDRHYDAIRNVSYQIPDLVVNVFHQTKTMTPSVIKYYESIAPYYWDDPGASALRYAVFSLKEKGRGFLPFLNGKIREMEQLCGELLSPNLLEEQRGLTVGGIDRVPKDQSGERVFINVSALERKYPDCIDWSGDSNLGSHANKQGAFKVMVDYGSIHNLQKKYEQLLGIRFGIENPGKKNPYEVALRWGYSPPFGSWK